MVVVVSDGSGRFKEIRYIHFRGSSYDELVMLHISDMDKFVEFESSLEDKLKRKLMVTIYKCIASEISFCNARNITPSRNPIVLYCVYVLCVCVYIYIYIYIYIYLLRFPIM